MVDEPRGKRKTGGRIAAPVFKRIALQILAVCGAPSDAPAILASSGGTCGPVKRRSKSVTPRMSHRPGEWIVPDLAGLNMRQVLDVCAKMKCDVSFQGTGYAVKQQPKPGKPLKEGARLHVFFRGRES
jgi:hypothetical protein